MAELVVLVLDDPGQEFGLRALRPEGQEPMRIRGRKQIRARDDVDEFHQEFERASGRGRIQHALRRPATGGDPY